MDPTWANPRDPNHDAYNEQLACGFQVGHNIVVCPSALPGGSRGFQSLASVDPGPGSNLDCYKSTWGAMFVHELSHVFGTRDWAPYYAYGFDPAKQIASDAAIGQSHGATPLTNADTFSLFALGELYISNVPSVLHLRAALTSHFHQECTVIRPMIRSSANSPILSGLVVAVSRLS